MALIEDLKNRWYLYIVILLSIIFSLYCFYFILIIGHESFSTLRLYESNESYAQQGKIFMFSDEDFNNFPPLGSVISDRNKQPSYLSHDGRPVYMVGLTSGEMNRFNAKYWSKRNGSEDLRYLEYQGKYYEYDVPQIH